MTQLDYARAGKKTALLRTIAHDEGITPERLRSLIASGHAVIPHNTRRTVARPCAIGAGLRTKINANIGTSKDQSSIAAEVKKLHAAVAAGADAIMDLSTGRQIRQTRQTILRRSPVPVGTVPMYEIIIEGLRRHGRVRDITAGDMLAILERQAREGVDFVTIHAGVVRRALDVLAAHPRILDIVSRGGAFLAQWMIENNAENPFYEHFDDVIAIAKRYDVTLSLGDGLRPGSILDATDGAQITELIALGELQERAVKAGVQVMIEGPGHVPIDQVEANVILEKRLCHQAPFYVLGPLVTDIAPGYDHITGAIGGALAGMAGADFLCYVTPSEHLRLPTIEDVKEGVIASKIAAHAADIAKRVPGAIERDAALSRARAARDWKRQFALAIDRTKPEAYRRSSQPDRSDVCTMCGEYCSIKVAATCLGRKEKR